MNLSSVLALLVAILRAIPALRDLAERAEEARVRREAEAERKAKDARNKAAIEAANQGIK